jgi:hypothetical protein
VREADLLSHDQQEVKPEGSMKDVHPCYGTRDPWTVCQGSSASSCLTCLGIRDKAQHARWWRSLKASLKASSNWTLFARPRTAHLRELDRACACITPAQAISLSIHVTKRHNAR